MTPMPIAELLKIFEDKKRLLHMVCHAALGHKFVYDMLLGIAEKSSLSYQDSLDVIHFIMHVVSVHAISSSSNYW